MLHTRVYDRPEDAPLQIKHCNKKVSVSPILPLEAQEQTGEILKQIKYLLLVTGKVWQRWSRSDRALTGNLSVLTNIWPMYRMTIAQIQ